MKLEGSGGLKKQPSIPNPLFLLYYGGLEGLEGSNRYKKEKNIIRLKNRHSTYGNRHSTYGKRNIRATFEASKCGILA